MDPLSVLSLVEACAGLAVTSGKLAIGLKSLADNYRSSALTFRSLSTQCRLFATAVRAIQAWMEEAPDTASIDDRIWEQLAHSLECANDAIYALECELVSTSKGTINTFWEKVNVVWNVAGLKEMQDCIHKQITGLGVILQIMNLPTRQRRTDGLFEQSSVFQESRSSAMSVRDGDASTIRGGGDVGSTIRAPSTIMTSLSQMPQFDFEEMLLTSQVYLRNRDKTLALRATSSKPGKMQYAGVSVSAWDLPAKDPQHNDIDDLLFKHEELQAKYSKVKRYYFESQSQVTALQEDVKKLKVEDPSHKADITLSETSTPTPSELPALSKINVDNENLTDQLETHKQHGQVVASDASPDTERIRELENERNTLKHSVAVQEQENQKLQK